jgi:DNA-binding GntR family transcriptional regulator
MASSAAQTAVERAYAAIRGGIFSGEHPAGGRLREEDLAERIGVSRTPVREALRRLDAEGLVEFMPNRGAHVASWTDQDLREIFALRALLESFGARLAAARIDQQALAALAELCDGMDRALADRDLGHLERVADLNNRFHQGVLAASGSRRLTMLLSSLVEAPLVYRTFRRYSAEQLARSMAHHRELLAALETGDGEWAESVMRSHVLAARDIFPSAGPQPS